MIAKKWKQDISAPLALKKSVKYKLDKSYIELFIFILIFFCVPHQNDIATTKIMKKAG